MLADEADGDNHEILGFCLAQFLKNFIGVGLQPLHRTHSALIGKRVGIGMAQQLVQLLHDQSRAGLDLRLIGIACFFDVALRHTVSTEENVGFGGVVAVADLHGNQFRHRPDITGMVIPAADAANRQLFKCGVTLAQTLQFTET